VEKDVIPKFLVNCASHPLHQSHPYNLICQARTEDRERLKPSCCVICDTLVVIIAYRNRGGSATVKKRKERHDRRAQNYGDATSDRKQETQEFKQPDRRKKFLALRTSFVHPCPLPKELSRHLTCRSRVTSAPRQNRDRNMRRLVSEQIITHPIIRASASNQMEA